jgi:ABC-type amino acid transport substrate-binding protein
MGRMRWVLIAAVAAVLALSVTGCGKKAEEPKPTPKVKPPAIAKAGTFAVGIDLDYPPFGGTDKGKKAGIDVDVASALAERLGLKLKIVSVKPSDAATALAQGDVDAVLSVPLTDATGATLFSGSYIADAPAFFGAADTSATVESLGAKKVATQKGSPAFWILERELGVGGTQVYDTLREAFQAVADGKADLAAGDALVGGYIARDFDDVRMIGQFGTVTLLGVAVKADNSELEAAVRTTLDSLGADGVFEAVRSTWVGDLPAIEMPAGASIAD